MERAEGCVGYKGIHEVQSPQAQCDIVHGRSVGCCWTQALPEKLAQLRRPRRLDRRTGVTPNDATLEALHAASPY
eukprot:scaffold52055_cov39-Tisochrysis_lutea.AAC.2